MQDPMPSLFSQGETASEIEMICRLDGGKRLVSILKAETLLCYTAIQKAIEISDEEEGETLVDNNSVNELDEEHDDTAQLVVFHVGEQEYGVSIDDVQEITRIPDNLEKVPKTADFIEGMVNLRGTVLPVLDMRTRFGITKMEKSERQRIIVLSIEGKRTGFIVDFVAEVLRLPISQIESSPNLSDDQARIMGKVVNLEQDKRMIQVLEARELLDEKEIKAIDANITAPQPETSAKDALEVVASDTQIKGE